MKFSKAWLEQRLDKKITTEQMVSQLNSIGLEVDSVESVAPKLDNIVVGEIIEVKPHPDADKLRVCLVNIGENKPVTIVTNVANVKPNIKVPVAKIGATLPDGLKITKAKLRGVESFGMFCGVDTLGLGEATEGLLLLSNDLKTGQEISKALALDDVSIDIELTPNRGDCLSIEGVARDLAAINDLKLKALKINEVAKRINNNHEVKITAKEACSRYLARVFHDVNLNAMTPSWMQERLRRSGIRAINIVVDITNYVMLEFGQPMHAFDADKLQGAIKVRFAEKAEKLTLLDGQEVELADNTLVIADDSGAIVMAGIMGGLSTSVTDETRNIVLESAFFEPDTIMGRARQYGLHTDSSHRFERGVDAELPAVALQRASELLVEIADAVPGPIVEQSSASHLPKRKQITLTQDDVEKLLGCEISKSEITNIFNKLGMEVDTKSNAWKVTPPSYRFDINLPADLVEEVARIYGYDNIPVRQPITVMASQPRPEYRFAELLLARDYHEVISYSFVDADILSKLTPKLEPLPLTNPISPELAVMRTTLWAGLISAAQYNINRQQHRVRLFETGLRFVPDKAGLQQIPSLAGLITGTAESENWANAKREVDFYDLKADVTALLALTGKQFNFEKADIPALHPGRSAKITHDNQEIGYLGALHPQIQQQLNLPTSYLFELDIEKIEQLMSISQFAEVSKFPAVRRDIAILTDVNIAIADICQTITKAAGNLLKDLIIFDVYKGEEMPQGQHSVALGITWQAMDKTLSDEDIEQVMQGILAALSEQHGATLRE